MARGKKHTKIVKGSHKGRGKKRGRKGRGRKGRGKR
jgi:hypothetical protein